MSEPDPEKPRSLPAGPERGAPSSRKLPAALRLFHVVLVGTGSAMLLYVGVYYLRVQLLRLPDGSSTLPTIACVCGAFALAGLLISYLVVFLLRSRGRGARSEGDAPEGGDS